ncbi:hypothetical protein T310_8564, partial [Rasamsonia emersonii CBS 393.64]
VPAGFQDVFSECSDWRSHDRQSACPFFLRPDPCLCMGHTGESWWWPMCFVADKKERSVGNPPSRLKVAEPIRKAPSAMSTWISRTMHRTCLASQLPDQEGRTYASSMLLQCHDYYISLITMCYKIL